MLPIPAPPLPSNQETSLGLALRPRRLKQVLIVLITVVVLSTLLAFSKGNWLPVGVLSMALMALVWAYWTNRRGQMEHAAVIILVTLTTVASGLVFISQGIHDEAVIAFPGLLIFASMFVRRGAFVSLWGVMALVLFGVVWANQAGWHVNVVQTNGWEPLITVLSILAATAFFIWMLASDLRLALERMVKDNERILESHARIEVLAQRDSLTNLPNRMLAKDRLEQIVASAKRANLVAAVLFLDLDNFKSVNDSLGHSAGDELLCIVAQRLLGAVRESDTVSRQGGDEFLILLSDVENDEAAGAVAAKIMTQLSQRLLIDGTEVIATGSLGIALFPRDGADADTLLKNADLAMYKAKDAGRNAYQFFDADMKKNVMEDLHLTTGIRAGLLNHEFCVHYQPQIDLRSGKIVGAEALLRWKHPTHGYISPMKFIPVAERSGLINEIGAFVLDAVCRQIKAWQTAGLSGLVVAVNVSPVQFHRDDIERQVHHALQLHQLDPACIELELTESLLMADSEHLSGVLDRLAGLGIKFAIDDFGTGYSNLGYLRRFAVERLKIDQSFVRDLTKNSRDDGIVRAIIEMAHCLEITVVAEGVETTATFARLRELGCEFGQGYLWSPAMPPEEFAAFVKAKRH